MFTSQIKLVVKVSGYWNFEEDIPLLKSPNHPRIDSKRVNEEIHVFNIWKKFNPKIPFDDLRYEGRNVFSVKVDCERLFGEKCFGRRYLRISILLPAGYPRSFPRIADDPQSLDDDIFKKMIRKTTFHAVFMCIPKIEYIWWKRNAPYAGIAHYLNIFLIWYSIVSKNKRLGIARNFYEEGSIVVL